MIKAVDLAHQKVWVQPNKTVIAVAAFQSAEPDIGPVLRNRYREMREEKGTENLTKYINISHTHGDTSIKCTQNCAT